MSLREINNGSVRGTGQVLRAWRWSWSASPPRTRCIGLMSGPGQPRRHHAAGRLQTRSACVRAGRPAFWDQVDFQTATLHVRRVKQGTPSTQPIIGDELRALRRLTREQKPKSAFVFTSECGAPFTTAGFARMVERAGAAAELGFKALRQRSPPLLELCGCLDPRQFGAGFA